VVAQIYAFNFSGFVSMGPVATSITGHRFGVPRLVRGIAACSSNKPAILPSLYAFDEPEIDQRRDDVSARLLESWRRSNQICRRRKPGHGSACVGTDSRSRFLRGR
jgi:hypothetical protein